MKKTISLLIALILIVLPFSVSASASDLADGIYEVPVTLMHKEDEKESFGNKYVAPVALLEVDGDSRIVTILLTTDMNGIGFSYYTNGSLEGDVSDGTSVSNVTVAGETYEQGFEIPVMADGDIGLKFSVPVMPMSPSARLRIDYDNAVLISGGEAATEAESEVTTTQTSTAVADTPTTTKKEAATQVQTSAATTELSTEAVTTTAPAETTVVYVTEAATEIANEKESGTPTFVYVVVFIAATAALAFLVFGNSKGVRDDDDK